MRYRIRVITLMAIAVAVFIFTIWMTSPQEVSGEVNSFTASLQKTGLTEWMSTAGQRRMEI